MQTARWVERAVKSLPFLEPLGEELSSKIHEAILAGGEGTRRVADLLHGTWLGHPLHPVMTDIPVGAWSLALLFDGLSLAGDEGSAEIADKLMLLGTLAAVPTALSGIVDYSTTSKSALPTATLHALLMDSAVTLNLLSLWQRAQGARGGAVALSTSAYGIMVLGAYLGGHLTFKNKVGVDHSDAGEGPDEWTTVMPQDELPEHSATRVEVEGQPVLLYRYGGTVYAIGAVCAHAGGPLEEGTFDGFCVECPWHQSVFDVRDGSVVHGPSTYAQPNYAARIVEGKVQIRTARSQRNATHSHA